MTPKILVVEDDPDKLLRMASSLGSALVGWEIVTARNESEAISLLAPDVILVVTDINLSDAGGKEDGGIDVLRVAAERTDARLLTVSVLARILESVPACDYIQRGAGVHDKLQAYAAQFRQQPVLSIFLPAQEGLPLRYQLFPRDLVHRETNRRLQLDSELLRLVGSSMGSLVGQETVHWLPLAQLVGQWLWDRIFAAHEEIMESYGVGLGLAGNNPSRMLIRIVGSAGLLDVPMELLHGPHGYLTRLHPLVRVIADTRDGSGQRTPPWTRPATALLIGSDTSSTRFIDIPCVDKEIAAVRSAIEPGLRGHLKTLHSCQLSHDSFRQSLNDGWDIVHYAGHGEYDERRPDNSNLYFWELDCSRPLWSSIRRDYVQSHNERGPLQPLSARHFAASVSSAKLVYLSCCHSARTGNSGLRTYSESLGLLHALAREGVPVAIGHRWPLRDDDHTLEFTRSFYDSLLNGEGPETAMHRARSNTDLWQPVWASVVMVSNLAVPA